MPITMERLEKEMGNRFGYEMKLYVYHKMNGRDAEAETYLNAYYDQQEKLKADYDNAEKEATELRMPRITEVYEEHKEEL